MMNLVQSRRRRREEAAAATLAAHDATPRLHGEAPVPTLPAHVPAAADRNVRPRLSPSQKTSSSPAATVSSSDYSRPYTVLRDHFCPLVSVTTAQQNRARRVARNKDRALMKKGSLRLRHIPLSFSNV